MFDPSLIAVQQAIATLEDATRARRLGEDDRETAVSLPAIDPCVAPAQLWLSAGWSLPTTMTFEVATPLVRTPIIFVSGTALSAVAAGFSTLALQADIDPDNPVRIRLAYGHGPEAFLCVRQLDTSDPLVLFSDATAEVGSHELCDEGVIAESGTLGDLDCDDDVDALDLASLIAAWGTSAGRGDLDESGLINEADLAILLGAWTLPPATSSHPSN